MEQSETRRLVGPALVAMTLGIIGTLCWLIGPLRRGMTRSVVLAPLWPRPDGSVRSYGEVWDHPDPVAV